MPTTDQCASKARTVPRRLDLTAVLLLIIAPLALVGPSVFGGRRLLPFDVARLPPMSTTMSAAELAAAERGPGNFDASDLTVLVLPELELAHREVAAGRMPEWNPYARFGAPLFANSLAGLAHPPNWVLWASSDPSRWLAWTAWMAFAVAGALTYLLLREFDQRPECAVFGALVFMFGGTALVNAHFYWRLSSLIWLPGLLLALTRLGRAPPGKGTPAGIGVAVCVALMWTSGFPPFAAIGSGIGAVWAGALVAGRARRDGTRAAIRLAACCAGFGLAGSGLAAVQVLPMLCFFPESNRVLAPAPDALAREAFDPMGFLGYLLPTAFGDPSAHAVPPYERSPLAFYLYSRRGWSDGVALFPHNYDFTEYTVFAGTLTVPLCIVGAFARGTSLRFAAAAAFAGLAWLATAPAILAPVLSLPGVSSVQPVRYMGPACLFVAMLAAIGLQSVARSTGVWRAVACAAVALALAASCAVAAATTASAERTTRLDVVGAITAHYAPRVPHLTREVTEEFLGEQVEPARERVHANLLRAAVASGLAACWFLLAALARGRPRVLRGWVLGTAAITLGELLAFARGVVVNVDVQPRRDSAVHAYLREQRDRLADRGGVVVARAAAAPKVPVDLPAGTLFPDRIRDLNAFAFVDSRSHLLFARVFGDGQLHHGHWPNAFPDDERLRHPVLDLMGLRFVLASEPLEHAGELVGPRLAGAGGEFFVYRRDSPLPRAFVVPALDVQPDDEAVVDRLADPSRDPAATAVVGPAEAASLQAIVSAPAPEARQRRVRFVRDSPVEIDLAVANGPAGYLVLADSCMSGWSATVDGAPAPIVRGNLFMRVIPLPAGAREVTLRYRTPGLALGFGVTAISLALLAFAAVRARRR